MFGVSVVNLLCSLTLLKALTVNTFNLHTLQRPPPGETSLSCARASATNTKAWASSGFFASRWVRVSIGFLVLSRSIGQTSHCGQQLIRLNRLGDMALVSD
jgi:hypothetical protein